MIIRDLLGSELESSQPPIYDAPIGLRRLYVDPVSGDEHYLVHYPKGLTARPHHHTAAHTIIVLAGAFLVDGQILGPGSYCHQPAGQSMHHEPAPGRDCSFFTVFHGPFDVFPET